MKIVYSHSNLASVHRLSSTDIPSGQSVENLNSKSIFTVTVPYSENFFLSKVLICCELCETTELLYRLLKILNELSGSVVFITDLTNNNAMQNFNPIYTKRIFRYGSDKNNTAFVKGCPSTGEIGTGTNNIDTA